MMKKRWCGALLALALVLTLLPTQVFAAGGTGTAADPILIGSADKLKDFCESVNWDSSLCAKLTDDIVLNDGMFDEDGNWSESGTPEQWTPIGNLGNEYFGTFDGGGHAIQGLYINSDGSNIGLFGSVKNATIKNLTVTGYVKGKNNVGGIVGWAYENISIQNCVNLSNVTGDGSGVGGLVGWASNGSITIQNCANCGNVTGSKCVGGLVGQCEQNSIQNCANLGGVKGTCTAANDAAYTGGIVGYAVRSVTMTACYNIGKVKGDKCVGGLVGWANNTLGSTASNCYYLNDTDTANAFGNTNCSDGDTTGWKKSETDFTDGSVLNQLRGSSTESPWANTCKPVTVGNTSMTLPWFAHPGNEHNWSTWQHQNSTHTRKCQNSGCDATITENCSGGRATCTAAAVCTVCGEKYGEPDPNHHENLKHVDAKAATTTAEGNIEYWHCAGCDKYYADATAKQEIAQANTVIARLPGSTPYYPPSYAVTVEKAGHGSVTVSPKYAAAGATVTVTVTPDEGYTLENLTVIDRNGSELPLTDKGGGKYTFPMPSGSVSVKATFMDDNTMLNFFTDVKSGDYFYDAVLWAAKNGITSGTDAAHFLPNLPCTRAQIVTFLWRAAGSPVVNYAMNMADVPEGSYYAEAVRWALSLGITTGTGADAFSPDEPCTRAQAVTFLARARNAKASGKAAFSDVPSGSYYADAVAWAAESGITTGTSDTTFSPDEVCTRAQIVTFLWRAFQ